MKKFYILFSILIYVIHSNAQITTIFNDELSDASKSRIGISGDCFANASSLTANFISKFYKGGYIDVKLKDQVLARTKNSNRIGAELNYGVFCALKLDSLFNRDVFSLFFSVRDRQHFDAHFPKDFYKVGFYGNAAYAGKIADFNNFSLNLIRYQQFQIGLFSSKLDSAARWGISLSFLKGEQYESIFAKKARLFTSADGLYLDFDTQLEMAQSDLSNKGIGAFNGYGASVDIYFEAPIQTKKNAAKIIVSVTDIGLIRFNNQSVYRSQDSVFHYTGFEIKSIFDIRDSTFLNTSQDSIQNKILPGQKRSVTATLPSTLNLSFETNFNEHFRLVAGIRHIFNANYKLLGYIKGSVYFNKRATISATFGYGGYSGINCGVGLGVNMGSGFSLYAGSSNLEGFIAPAKTAGKAVYFSIIKNFN